MWPSPNIRSLPSKEEIQRANEEISIIELEIVEAELRLDALRRSLSERKAWIAPIRRIPPEILSLIFIDASKTDWKAPLVLQSVSRQWRDVVLDSAEAWMFIPLSECSSENRPELISLFLQRSRNKPLHILVQDDSLLRYMELLADRIKFFHLRINTVALLSSYLQRGHKFHRLERLRIWHRDPAEDTQPAGWDMLLFPNLKVLDINSRSLSLFRAILGAPEFPAIRHLTVKCRDPWTISDILTKCAMSLESVHLIHDDWRFEALDIGPKLRFPRLTWLQFWDFSHGLRFRAATPNLQALLDDGINSTLNTVEVDTGSVVVLHVLRTPDLSRYPRLATLHFSGEDGQGEEVIEAANCLRDNPTLCPDLALIEYSTPLTEEEMAKGRDALMARGQVTGQIIQLTRGTGKVWREQMQSLRVGKLCEDHMPCSFSI